MPGTRRWHGVYAEENAFAICPAMKWPPWLHMIPDMGYIPGLDPPSTAVVALLSILLGSGCEP